MKPLFVGSGLLRVSVFRPYIPKDAGAYIVRVMRMCIYAYVHMSVCPSVRDPVRLRLTFL